MRLLRRGLAARTVVPAVALALAAACSLSAAASAAPQLPGHALLVNRPNIRVYGPAEYARTVCPSLLLLPAHPLATVKRAVALAMPRFEANVKLDGREPVVKVSPAARSGFDYRAGGCGEKAWQRSIVAFVSLPHVTEGASLSQHTLAVARVRQGWVLWAVIH